MSSTCLRYSALIVCLVVLGVSAVPEVSKTCANTRSVFDSITVQDLNGRTNSLKGNVYNELQSAMECSTCKLSQTCCSNEAENSFKSYIVDHYRDKILSKLSNPLIACHNHSVFGEIKSYIKSSKDNLVTNMLRAYGGYFQSYINIFDKFFKYLESTIETGNTCRLAEEWNEVYYEVFLAAYFSSPSTSATANQLPSSSAFRQCFYQVFLENKGDTLATELKAFQRSFNRTMRYLRALRSLDRVILSTVEYLLRPECQASIMKMTHCSSCAGVVAPTCDGLCLNVMRGCLVDLSDLFQSLDNFSAALVELQSAISSRNELYYFWSQLDLFQSNLFILISDTVVAGVSIEQDVLLKCDANGRRAKRDAPVNPNPVRNTRQTTAAPFRSLNDSAYCIVGALSSLRVLPDSVCQSSNTDSTQCWNGNSVGSYGRAILDFNRQSQINNPEMVVKGRERHFEQQIANLQAATREMNILSGSYECESDDEDDNCSVPETCEYYDFYDAPYTLPPEVEEMSGSGSGSGSSYENDRSTIDSCGPVTTPPRISTTSFIVTEEPTTAIVNEITEGTTIGGPGFEITNEPSPIGATGSAIGLTSSFLLVILVTCSVFLL